METPIISLDIMYLVLYDYILSDMISNIKRIIDIIFIHKNFYKILLESKKILIIQDKIRKLTISSNFFRNSSEESKHSWLIISFYPSYLIPYLKLSIKQKIIEECNNYLSNYSCAKLLHLDDFSKRPELIEEILISSNISNKLNINAISMNIKLGDTFSIYSKKFPYNDLVYVDWEFRTGMLKGSEKLSPIVYLDKRFNL